MISIPRWVASARSVGLLMEELMHRAAAPLMALAAVFAAQKNWERAMESAKSALELISKNGSTHDVAEIQQKLEDYHRHRP